jgi:hypothetical protein
LACSGVVNDDYVDGDERRRRRRIGKDKILVLADVLEQFALVDGEGRRPFREKMVSMSICSTTARRP